MTNLITCQHLQTDIADLLRQARTAAVCNVFVQTPSGRFGMSSIDSRVFERPEQSPEAKV